MSFHKQLVELIVTSHNFYPYLGNAFLDLLDDYAKYKGKTNFPAALAGDIFIIFIKYESFQPLNLRLLL